MVSINRLTARVDKDLRQTSCTPGPDLTPDPLSKVDNAGPDDETPRLVSKTVLGRVVREAVGVVGVDRVADEASSSVRVKTDEEEEREVMCVPEGLEALVADLVVGGGVHKQHDEEQEVAGDATRLGVVDIQSELRANLRALDIDEVDVVRGRVHHRPEGELISDLPVEPDVLVGGEEGGYTGTDDTDDVTELAKLVQRENSAGYWSNVP